MRRLQSGRRKPLIHMASGYSLASFSDPGVAQRTRRQFIRLVLEAHGLRHSDGLVTVLWVGCAGCGACWLSETGGSTTLSVTDGSRRRGGDGTSRFPLCPVANLRNFNAPNPCPERSGHCPQPRTISVNTDSTRRPVPAEIGHASALMQTAPPSRIMPGGAVLNPDSAIPRQLSVCGGAIRFIGQRQSISRKLCFEFRDLIPDAP